MCLDALHDRGLKRILALHVMRTEHMA